MSRNGILALFFRLEALSPRRRGFPWPEENKATVRKRGGWGADILQKTCRCKTKSIHLHPKPIFTNKNLEILILIVYLCDVPSRGRYADIQEYKPKGEYYMPAPSAATSRCGNIFYPRAYKLAKANELPKRLNRYGFTPNPSPQKG